MEALTRHLASRQTSADGPDAPIPARSVTFAEDNKEPQKVSRTTTFADTAAPRLNRSVTYVPSLLSKPNESSISYTSDPLKLLWYDIKLCLGKITAAPGIIMPWRIGSEADPFDELYPNLQNIISLTIHTILIFTQTVFLVSIPFFVFVPSAFFVAWIAFFMVTNSAACYILNGNKLKVYPSVEVDREGKFSDEYWIFLNGVSVGWVLRSIDFSAFLQTSDHAEDAIGCKAISIGSR
jgi:hypothetical protein